MTSSLRVLGIDPGLTRCGVGIVDVDRARRATLVHVGVVRTPADADLAGISGPVIKCHAFGGDISNKGVEVFDA